MLAHQTGDPIAVHGAVARQTDIEAFSIGWERIVLILHQLVGRIHGNDTFLLLKCWQVGSKAFAITGHSHVKDDVYIGIVERRHSFDLVF